MIFDLIITIAMIIGGAFLAGSFWKLTNKGFKGIIFATFGAVLGAVTVYLIFLFIALVIWLLVNMR
jgi:hypothetical protein